MTIYRVYDSMDGAVSDTWLPTLSKAIAHLRDTYGIKGEVKLAADGSWEKDTDDFGTVYLNRFELQMTREGVCSALQFWPIR